ncbi:growth hormone-regulated TBC protein 1-like [Oscarella lobularis]|uniref:growth hormone-regulated TBC protein 1-like n=1 Tax=Oscarella lobularis TaxID=121494 RepID=UPI0033137720
MATSEVALKLRKKVRDRHEMPEEATEETEDLWDTKKVCPYGFQRPDDFDYVAYNRFLRHYAPILKRREKKWASLLKHGFGLELVTRKKLRRYIRKGISKEYRCRVWLSVSGALKRMESNRGLYQTVLKGERDAAVVEAIKMDIRRTFPDNVRFAHDTKGNLLGSLENVLTAYAHYNKKVGYCQGLNFVAGMLLLVAETEEEAFWLLLVLVEKILPENYYNLRGVWIDIGVLKTIMEERLPLLLNHFDANGIDLNIVAARWFICLFVDVLHAETLLRVWDCLFNEGSVILFRVALTLLIQSEKEILACEDLNEILTAYKKIGNKTFDCHAFTLSLFQLPEKLKRKQIDLARKRQSDSAT